MTTTNSHPSRYIGKISVVRQHDSLFLLGLLKDVRVRGGFQSGFIHSANIMTQLA